jgi:hypothetical protein
MNVLVGILIGGFLGLYASQLLTFWELRYYNISPKEKIWKWLIPGYILLWIKRNS